ncbi:hypothetical protein [Jannaschia seohaensis]|uniref:Uncharacterized protein n=1 Tax=Jannaschia seohaensis TaxID=475081 RepID=A0A2Y9B1B2_9RHOB|nr:hypothetical protein [Jannaschia seohaensis]PWJ14460.1 hypothetical protein BCF38_11283 [Jannaschia seohaensis]SSA50206.1 hypothetical protein SAMN05421539_11283 [Jannaschia seohaensis]
MMNLFEVLVLSLSLGLGLAVVRFAMLAFLPAHPMSQFISRLDRLFGDSR